MPVPRRRAIYFAGLAIAGIWMLAMTGYFIANDARVTAEKVRAYAESVVLSQLSAADRAKALQRLADMLNALSAEERQRARFNRVWMRWLDQMTEREKGDFLDKTLPTGFKQMLDTFEKLPEDQRRRTIDDAMRRLRADQEQLQASDASAPPGQGGPPISSELQAKIRTIGLSTYFSQSSAQTKAELAPLLEELQRSMQSGHGLRHR